MAGCVVAVAAVIGVLVALHPWEDAPEVRVAVTSTSGPGPDDEGSPGSGGFGQDAAGRATATTTAQTTSTTGQASLAVLPGSSWVMVLESIPYADGLDAARAYQDGFSRAGYRTSLIDTANHPGLTLGYYAVVLGPFSSRSSARAHCVDAGRVLGGDCYERYVE